MVDGPQALTGRYQVVAPYEANLVAQAEQKRLSIARPALVALARLRASINRVDHSLAHHGEELNDARRRVREGDNRAYAAALSRLGYWVGVTLLLVLEMTLNKGALDQLRIEELHAWMSAGFISLVNFFAAKSSARVLRQWPSMIGEPAPWLIALAANAALVASLSLLAGLRAQEAAASGTGFVFLALQLAGYSAILFLSFHQIDPSSAREQLTRLIQLLETRVDVLWRERVALADRHNTGHEQAGVALRDIVQDCNERVYQYRDANMQARSGPSPDFFNHALSPMVFEPIDLGHQVDPHPASVEAVIGDAPGKGDDQ